MEDSFHQPLIKPQTLNSSPEIAVLSPSAQVTEKFLSLLKKQNIPTKSRTIAGLIPWHSYTLHETQYAIAGPFLGSPAAAIVAETFLSSGTTKLILIGPAGGLQSETNKLEIGDLICPTGGLSEEGTSKLYNCHDSPILPKQQAVGESLQLEIGHQISMHRGLVWTTDAPFRETRTKCDQFSRLGAIAVDMEYTSILATANAYRAELCTRFIISDLLGKDWKHGFQSAPYKETMEAIILSTIFLRETR